MKNVSVRTVALGIAAAAVAFAIILAIFARKDAAHEAHYSGTPLDPPKEAYDTTLIDQNGREAHVVDRTAAATFLFFGYTHCPDECPLALAALGRAYRSVDARIRAKTRIVFVTVDPARDTPNVLARYAGHFDRHIVALTGSRANLERVWQAYGVEVQPQGKELVGHGGTIYAVNGAGRIVLIYPPDVKPADIAHDATALAS